MGIRIHSSHMSGLPPAAVTSIRARRFLYFRRDCSPLQWARLGQVLASIESTHARPASWPAALPAWYCALLADVRRLVVDSFPIDVSPSATTWPGELLEQIAVAGGLRPEMALVALFERWADSYSDRWLSGLVVSDATGFADYLDGRRAELDAALPLLSEAGKRHFFTLMEHPTLVGKFEDAIARSALLSDPAALLRTAPHLLRMSVDGRTALVAKLLDHPHAECRRIAAFWLTLDPSETAEQALQGAVDKETDPAARRGMWLARMALRAARDAAGKQQPVPPAFVPAEGRRLGSETLAALTALRGTLLSDAQEKAREEDEINKQYQVDRNYHAARLETLVKLDDDQLDQMLAIINGDRIAQATREQAALFSAAECLWNVPGFDMLHAARIRAAGGGLDTWQSSEFRRYLRELPAASRDLRVLADAFARCKLPVADAVPWPNMWRNDTCLSSFPHEGIWPLLFERPEIVAEVLFKQEEHRYDRVPFLEVLLDSVPALHHQWIGPLVELAFHKRRDFKAVGRKAMLVHPDMGRWFAELLTAPLADLRIHAANWLVQLDYRAALPELLQLLQGETDDAARAAMLAAVERLGGDMTPYLSPEAMLAKARDTMSEKLPATRKWFPFEDLPACRWEAGGDVPPEVIRSWVLVAWTLNDARGNALLDRYLALLTPASRSALGSFILKAFLAYDTAPPSQASIEKYADKQVAERNAQNAKWGHPAMTPESEASYREAMRREKLRECAGSAIGAKGILALAAFAPGHELVSRTRSFMRNYRFRLAQIEALLGLLAHSGANAALQLLLDVSRNHSKETIRNRAKELVEELSEINSWTEQEFADRSIPTAGFDERGELVLDYGERQFVVTLSASLVPVLTSPEGKVLKALPDPRADDDGDAAKAAKQQFSACKKEIKLVVEQQKKVLRDAMFVQRVWTTDYWRQFVLAHPILGRLSQQLVWEELAADGTHIRYFRPDTDKSLINTDDEVVELGVDSGIRLAHCALMPEAESVAWLQHLRDYKVASLFPQFGRALPAFDSANPPKEINDRKGWMANVHAITGGFEKLGYARGEVGDGGYIRSYYKPLQALGLTIEMAFSGVFVQGGGGDAALTTLSFISAHETGRFPYLALDAVPPIVLAEAYADYLAVAAGCRGFESNWQSLV
ncbi:MAG: DUF4132 domain-containing protein [Burkholderiales bacterium]|nr:DUF4132 domain-containing protein [Burkholderiales bacterium]